MEKLKEIIGIGRPGGLDDLLIRVVKTAIAAAIAATVIERGGTVAGADLAGYETIDREPVRARFGGCEILTNPPPSSGGILIAYALELLTRAGGATDPAGLSLFLVERSAPGVTVKEYRTIDELRAADVWLSDVSVPAAARLGDEGRALPLIEDAADYATALLCAEAVGAIRFANEATLEYLKTRRQFGVPIGSFQALQHRMVDMVISYEQARSMACLACVKVDTAPPAERRHAVSAAKVKVADACRHVSQEAVQLHGGMGMTEELKISHTFRRLTMIGQTFGDAEHHLERFARSEVAGG